MPANIASRVRLKASRAPERGRPSVDVPLSTFAETATFHMFRSMTRFVPKNKSYLLAQLFESNYRKLRELIPELGELQDHAVAFSHGKPALHLTVLERSRYTVTVELHHRFGTDFDRLIEPRIRIRIYLDGRCAEALREAEREPEGAVHTLRRAPAEILEDKWSANYFLERWLSHCVQNRYRFERGPTALRPAAFA